MRTLERSDPITRLSPTIRRRTCVVVIAVLTATITCYWRTQPVPTCTSRGQTTRTR